ncbi:MAG: hypothetical protein LBU53_02545 [Zoogloeaceae bacterium]|jgi:type IV pilus assembly protein PilY1|nr:hypothetical protein [Zoogloeaceae bacterium]
MSKNHAGFMKRALLMVLAGIFSSAAMPLDIYQGPLVEDKSMDPNLIYFHDNSGSMTSNYMPMEVGGTTGSTSVLRKANFFNRLYYNPDVTYVPPLKYEAGDGSTPPRLVSWRNMDQRCTWPRVMRYGMSGTPYSCEITQADRDRARTDYAEIVSGSIDLFNDSLDEHLRNTPDGGDPPTYGTIKEARIAYDEMCMNENWPASATRARREWQRTTLGTAGKTGGNNASLHPLTTIGGSPIGATGGSANTDNHTLETNCYARSVGLINHENWQEAQANYMAIVSSLASDRDDAIAQAKAELDIANDIHNTGTTTLTASTAVYYDYVPGFNSRIDNAAGYTLAGYEWEPIVMVNGVPVMEHPERAPEKVDGNYETHAFSYADGSGVIRAGALFRIGGANKVSQTATTNAGLVYSRACPILFRDVSDSRAYYSNEVSPEAPGDDYAGNPHGHCRYSYRAGDVDYPSNYQRWSRYAPWGIGGVKSVGGLQAANGIGRPWCYRTTRLNNITTANVERSCYQGKHIIGDTDGTARWTAGRGATSSLSNKDVEVSHYRPDLHVTDEERDNLRIAANRAFNEGLDEYINVTVPQARAAYDSFCRNEEWLKPEYDKGTTVQKNQRKNWQYYDDFGSESSTKCPAPQFESLQNALDKDHLVPLANAATTPVRVSGAYTVIGDCWTYPSSPETDTHPATNYPRGTRGWNSRPILADLMPISERQVFDHTESPRTIPDDYDVMFLIDDSWRTRNDLHVGVAPVRSDDTTCNSSYVDDDGIRVACTPTLTTGESGSDNCWAYVNRATTGTTIEEWRNARNEYYLAVNSLVGAQVQAYLDARNLKSSIDQSLEHRVSKFVDDEGNLYEESVARPRTAAEEIRNFANWYSYYSSRSMAAKTGISLAFGNLLNKDNTYEPGKILNGKSIRLGYDVLNGMNANGPGQRTGTVAKVGRGVVPFLDFPRDAKTADGVKHPYAGEHFVRDFYNWVASITVRGDTPLRIQLDRIGKYYETDNPWLEYPPIKNGGQTAFPGVENKEFACRRSFTIMMTDGYWNGAQASTADARADVDGKNGPEICRTDENNVKLTGKENCYKYTPAPPFFGENRGLGNGTHPVNNSLADIAMYYWNRDLRPDTPNLIAPTRKNPAFWQHMQTFTLGLGVLGRLSDKEVNRFLANGTNKNILWTFPTGLDTSYERIDDLMHAGLNGHGGTAAAEDAGEFADKLTQLLTEISGVDGTFTTPAAPSTLTKDAQVYEASYSPTDWTGELLAYGTCIKGESGCSDGFIQLPPLWSASEKLRDIKHDERKIFTMVGGTATEFKSGNLNSSDIDVDLTHNGAGGTSKCPFAWSGISGQCRLGKAGGSAPVVDYIGGNGFEHLINYLRGDQQYEDTTTGLGLTATYFNGFRSRSFMDANGEKQAKLLGDIVNSSPVLVTPRRDGWNKSPVLGYKVDADDNDVSTDAALSYAERLAKSFKVDSTTKQITIDTDNRKLVVLVGAGDGMLHGFDARPLDDTSAPSDKEAAGKELFAFIPSAVHGILKKLADPQYGQTKDLSHSFYVDGVTVTGEYLSGSDWKAVAVGSTGRSDAPASSYFALDVENPLSFSTGNVLWEIRDPNLGTPANGQASIALLCNYDKDTNECAGDPGFYAIFGNGYSVTDENWTSTLFTAHMTTGSASLSLTGDKGGLSRPTVIGYNNGTSVFAYAGDLQGNLWKFDLREFSPKVVGKLMVATDPKGNPQPITGAPRVVIDGDDIQVVVATGKYLSQEDVKDESVQTIYSVRDTCGFKRDCDISTAKRDGSGGGALAEVKVSTGEDGGWSLEKFAAPLNYPSVQGFFIDLDAPGMTGLRGIAKATPELRAGTNQVAVPLLMPSVDPCAAAVEGVIMEVDAMNGAPKKSLLFASLKDAAYREGNGLDIAISYSIDGGPPNFGVNDAEIGGTNDPKDCLTARKLPGGGLVAGALDGCGGKKKGRQSWRQLR